MVLDLIHAHNFRYQVVNPNKATFSHRNVLNLFIDYELDTWSRALSTKFTLVCWSCEVN